jgi:hypothetical protein
LKVLWCLLPLAACGYHPPPQADVTAKSYQTDLAACQDTAHTNVNKQNSKRALDWFSSPVRRWGQIREAEQSCMVGKGYGDLRWCTADELKGGKRSGSVIVTSAGVQCTDPPAPEHLKTPT